MYIKWALCGEMYIHFEKLRTSLCSNVLCKKLDNGTKHYSATEIIYYWYLECMPLLRY